jgi:hypothetical protein
MEIKTNVRAGSGRLQHNKTMARGLRCKTNIKSGNPPPSNHNQKVASRLKVKTNVKAALIIVV